SDVHMMVPALSTANRYLTVSSLLSEITRSTRVERYANSTSALASPWAFAGGLGSELCLERIRLKRHLCGRVDAGPPRRADPTGGRARQYRAEPATRSMSA